MSLNIKPRSLIIKVLFFMLLFIMCLDSLSNIKIIQFFLKHVDELITVFLLMYIFLNYKSAFRVNKKLAFLWIGVVSIGLFSSIIYQYQRIVPVIIEVFIMSGRFLIGYYAVSIFLEYHHYSITCEIEKLAKIVVIVLFILSVHDLIFTPFFPKGDYRYFMYSLQLMFPHTTYLGAASSTLLILLGYRNSKNNNIIYMIMASFLGFTTLRSKVLGFLLLYWLVYLLVNVFKRRQLFFVFIVGIFGVLLISWKQIILYFFSVNRFSPRSILLNDSIKLMTDHFPLGTGFGTFGTVMAEKYYSPLYIQLGYPNYTGMGPKDSMFLSDSFWPGIIAQFGAIGVILFLGIVTILIKLSIDKMKVNKIAGLSMLMIMVYMLIASMAETAFFNPTALLMFMQYALFEKEL